MTKFSKKKNSQKSFIPLILQKQKYKTKKTKIKNKNTKQKKQKITAPQT